MTRRRIQLSIGILLSVSYLVAGGRPPDQITSRAPEQGNVETETERGILSGPDFNFLDRTKNDIYLTYCGEEKTKVGTFSYKTGLEVPLTLKKSAPLDERVRSQIPT